MLDLHYSILIDITIIQVTIFYLPINAKLDTFIYIFNNLFKYM